MNKNLTEIAFILDRSGSMNGYEEAAVSGFNAFLKEQKEAPGEALITLHLFDDEHLRPRDRTPIKEASEITQKEYEPRGMTALYDAIGSTIAYIEKCLSETPKKERPGHVIIAIFTDGLENASVEFSQEILQKKITQLRENEKWEFMFLAADQDAVLEGEKMGIEGKYSVTIEKSGRGIRSSNRSWSKSTLRSRELMREYGTVKESLKASLMDEYEAEYSKDEE